MVADRTLEVVSGIEEQGRERRTQRKDAVISALPKSNSPYPLEVPELDHHPPYRGI